MLEYPFLADCERCGHNSDMHRHDDSMETEEFRCLGYDPSLPGPPPPGGRACDCPDMVRSDQNLIDLGNVDA